MRPYDAQRTPFGALLCRLRTARLATTRQWRGNQYRWVTATLSQNELARRAGIDTAYVHDLERGKRSNPRRAIVTALAEALALNDAETATLLIAAGYWPWHDLDDDTAALVAQTALAVIAGDYRALEDG